MHFLTPILLSFLTLPTIHASALKSVGQLDCSRRDTNVYLCYDTQHYAMCKSDYGYTNIYEVPEGKDWCAHATNIGFRGTFASAASTAFDGKVKTSTTTTSNPFRAPYTPVSNPPGVTAGAGGMQGVATLK